MVEHNYKDFDSPSESGSRHNGLGELYGLTGDLIGSMREFCRTWARAVKTICLYPETNPLPSEFRQKFFDALSSMLDTHGSFTLTTFDGGFGLSGETVYEEDAGDDHLSFILFRDGVREVAFHPGVTRDESDRFLSVLAGVYSAGADHVDVANVLWEAGFDHIKHMTVDRVVEGVYIDSASNETLDNVHKKFLTVSESGTDSAEEGEESDSPDESNPYRGVQRERYKYILNAFGDVVSLSDSERQDLSQQCGALSDREHERLGLDVLAEILRSAGETRIVEDTLSVMEKQLHRSVDRGRWEITRDILSVWQDADAEASDSTQRRIRDVINRAAHRSHFEKLAVYLNDHPQIDLEPIKALLYLHRTAAVMPITAMLGTLKHRPARMMVCDYLAQHGGDTIDLVGGFIYDKRWYVVRNIAMILGEIGHDRGVVFLRRSATHRDARVRLETLRAADKIGSPAAQELLRGFLNDDEVDLRKRALRALGNSDHSAVREELRARVENESELPDMDHHELRELFIAHVRLSGDRAVADLVAIARRSRVFGRAKWQPVRVAAVHALAESDSGRARRELQALSHDRNRIVAAAAQTVLHHVRDGRVPDADETIQEASRE